MSKRIGFLFLTTSLVFLLFGVLMGVLGGLLYLFPQDLKDILPFAKLRPLHVSAVVFFILFAAIGGVYLYAPKTKAKSIKKLGWWQFFLLLGAAVAILGCYLGGFFGGREYWEYPPVLAIPIATSFILLAINYFKSISTKKEPWPVYRWMWFSGILFFILSFAESYLWLIPHFRDNIVRDMAVQWKSYGSLVGAWNMLVNGSALYIMEKMSGDKSVARKPLTFIMFFLGLFNLMFNWGHHIYSLPVSNTIRYTAYLVSMTELLILGKIIWNWRSSLSGARKHAHLLPYRFLTAADIWIFLNLAMAILMSVPAINLYTHGTHITVAHAMGTTIGINTMLLLASACYACTRYSKGFSIKARALISRGLFWTNGSLLLFWLSLIGAGVGKAALQVQQPDIPHALLMQKLAPWYAAFTISGAGIAFGIALVALALLRSLLAGRQQSINKTKTRTLQIT